tara:strand:- start:300 stop:476 length:177 start_codon:yes stop_codon:yes gene_type:complete
MNNNQNFLKHYSEYIKSEAALARIDNRDDYPMLRAMFLRVRHDAKLMEAEIQERLKAA